MYHARQDLLLRLRFLDNHLKVLVLQNNLIIVLFHLWYIPSKNWCIIGEPLETNIKEKVKFYYKFD